MTNQQANLPATIEQHQDKFLSLMDNPEKFEQAKNLFISQVNANPKLASASPASLIGCFKEIVQYDLSLKSKNVCHIVPYSGSATLQLGYRGFEQIAYKHGVKHINKQVVYADDNFKIDLANNVVEIHEPGEIRTEFKGVYCVATMKTGESLAVYFTKAQIDEKRKRSKSQQYWSNGFSAMALKTAIIALCKRLPDFNHDFINADYEDIGKKDFNLDTRETILEAESASIFDDETENAE